MFTAVSLGSLTAAIQSMVDGPQHGIGNRAALLVKVILGDLPDYDATIAIVFNPFTLAVRKNNYN